MSEQDINQINNPNTKDSDEISLKELIQKIKDWAEYLKTKWKIIVLAGIIGAFIGFIYANTQQVTYTAELTYILEDNNQSNNGNNLGLLASQLGLSNSSTNSNNGMFSISNLQELMKSKLIIAKTLLSPVIIDGKNIALIEYFISKNNIRKSYENNHDFKNIFFSPNEPLDSFSISKTIIFGNIYLNLISAKNLSFESKDKKASLLHLSVTSNDELFSKLFCEKLIQATTQFYIDSKTNKAKINVEKLQKQVDSVRSTFYNAINNVALATDQIYNLNPALKIKGISPVKKQVDVQANTILLSSLITNVEMAKTALYNQTPLFQIIDKPRLPLSKNTPNLNFMAILGAFSSAFLSSFCLLLFKSIKFYK